VIAGKPDMTDLPSDQFLVAADAYEELKRGRVAEKDIGIFDFVGWRYVWYTLFSDLACVCGAEIMPWEGWGICDRIGSDALTESDTTLLLRICELLRELDSRPDALSEARELFATHPDLAVPNDYEPHFNKLPAFA
jgi:hypothetical protein